MKYLISTLIISISTLVGCNPDKSKDVAKPVEATSPDSKDSKSDSEPRDLIGNLLERVKVENLEQANKRYGKNKIDTFIRECEKKFPKMQFSYISSRPVKNCASANQFWCDVEIDRFSKQYGADTEVSIEVSQTLKNRFDEDYQVKENCHFSGPPHWVMVDWTSIPQSLLQPALAPEKAAVIEVPDVRPFPALSMPKD
jgi:hypothetical protein